MFDCYCANQELTFDLPDNGGRRFITGERKHVLEAGGLQIVFKFTCKSLIDEWAMLQDYRHPAFQGRVTRPVLETNVVLPRDQFRNVKKVLLEKLGHWPIQSRQRRKIVSFAVRTAVGAIGSLMADFCSAIAIDVPVTVVHSHVWSVAETVAEMVPAAEWAVDELLRDVSVAMVRGQAEKCTVCLEEMEEGCEATAMPCSHVFHGECIRRWLHTSHYCPVCRFKMPITREVTDSIQDPNSADLNHIFL